MWEYCNKGKIPLNPPSLHNIGILLIIHAFFIRTSNFRLKLGCSQLFGDFSLKLFLICSYFLIFPNSVLVAQNNKKALRNTCLLFFHLETVNTASANATSLLITLPASDVPANSNNSPYTCTSQAVYKD